MAKKKLYAVRSGRTIGVFETWEECQKSTAGYSGADFKSFFTEAEAKAYISNSSSSPLSDIDIVSPDSVIAYVNGSYDTQQQKYAFGCAIIIPNGSLIKESGCGNEPDGIALHNIAGELLGALHVTNWAINNGYHSIEIRHDSDGIAKWVTGEWKAKNKVTQSYATEIGKMKSAIEINFFKTHSNDQYNAEADRLAKEALKSGKQVNIKKGDYWFKAEGIETSDLNAIFQLIQEDFPQAQISTTSIPYGHRTMITVPTKEKVVVNYYNSRQLVISGKPETMFATITSYVTELLDIEKIPEIFNSVFNITVDKRHVQTEFEAFLPNSHNKLPEKMSKVLHQAVYNLNIFGDFYDSSFLVQPALRVLEGHLKNILIEQHILTDAHLIKSNGFYMFDKNGFKYQLKSDMLGISTPLIAKYIGNCYTYYHSNRHTLSHWDDPNAPLDTTRLINNAEAHDIIKRTLSLIDEYYKLVG